MNTKKIEQGKAVQLTREQIEHASSSLVVDSKSLISSAENPLYEMTGLLPQLQNSLFSFDDGSVDDSVYAAINHHANNSLCRAESGLKAVAEMLETIGCNTHGELNRSQALNLSSLLEMVVDSFKIGHELAEGSYRVLAVRNIARIQIASKTQGRTE